MSQLTDTLFKHLIDDDVFFKLIKDFQERDIERIAKQLYHDTHSNTPEEYKRCYHCDKNKHVSYFIKGCRQRKNVRIPSYELIPNYCTACRAYMNKSNYTKHRKINI
ncbi:MAG: hypothetical protein QM487_10695 [Candidatus Marithrix sp.]